MGQDTGIVPFKMTCVVCWLGFAVNEMSVPWLGDAQFSCAKNDLEPLQGDEWSLAMLATLVSQSTFGGLLTNVTVELLPVLL